MKLSWGTGIAIVYILFALSMITFAVVASMDKFDLVSENYYDNAVNYQQQINAAANTITENSSLEVKYDAHQNAIVINAMGNKKVITGTLAFYKPDKAENDFTTKFSTDTSGVQIVPAAKLAHGQWTLKASWIVDGKDCYIEKKIFIPR